MLPEVAGLGDGGVGDDPGEVGLGLHLLEDCVHPDFHRHTAVLVGPVLDHLHVLLSLLDGLHQLPLPLGELEVDVAVHLVLAVLPGDVVLAGQQGGRQGVPGRPRLPIDDPEDVGGLGPPPVAQGMAGHHVGDWHGNPCLLEDHPEADIHLSLELGGVGGDVKLLLADAEAVGVVSVGARDNQVPLHPPLPHLVTLVLQLQHLGPEGVQLHLLSLALHRLLVELDELAAT